MAGLSTPRAVGIDGLLTGVVAFSLCLLLHEIGEAVQASD